MTRRSRHTIDNVMRQCRLPFPKLTSRIVRFPKAGVDAYLARNFNTGVCNGKMDNA